jgi:hypothetical protein
MKGAYSEERPMLRDEPLNAALPAVTAREHRRATGPRLGRAAPAVDHVRDGGAWTPLTGASWLQAYNSAWLDGRWPELESLLASDVEFAMLGAGRVVSGRTEVVAMLRRRYARLAIHDFSATELGARRVGGIGIVSYRWCMDWHDSQTLTREFGQTAIGVRLLEHPWKALWIKEARG